MNKSQNGTVCGPMVKHLKFCFQQRGLLKGSTPCFIRKFVAILNIEYYPMFDWPLPFVSQIQCWPRIPFPS